MAKTGFTIAVGCPGCGGELELEENFFVLRCGHCSSTLRIRFPEEGIDPQTGQAGFQPPAYLIKGRKAMHEVRFAIDRYLRERGEPLTVGGLQFKQIYYPYWKIDAILLRTRNRIEIIEQVNEDGTESSYEQSREVRRTEVSLAPYAVTFPAGNRFDGVPHSIGLRASYVKAEPFAREKMQEGYRALPVVVNWAEARAAAQKTVGSVGRIDTPDFGKNRTEMFRPQGSIVYFPYWVAESFRSGAFRRWLVDAVTGEVAGQAERLHEGDYEEAEEMAFGRLAIGFHRCGNCGHDLPPEQSYVYICAHCGEVTTVEEHPLFGGEIGVGCHPSTPLRVTEAPLKVTDEAGADICLAQTPGHASGVGGTVKLTKTEAPTINGGPPVLLPFWLMTVAPEMAAKLKVTAGGLGASGRLVAPAFRMSNFEGAYRLGRKMTTAQASFALREIEEGDGGFAAVGVGPSEAIVMARVILARELAGHATTAAAPEVTKAFTDMKLFYVPFHREHYFYVDSVIEAVTVEGSFVRGR